MLGIQGVDTQTAVQELLAQLPSIILFIVLVGASFGFAKILSSNVIHLFWSQEEIVDVSDHPNIHVARKAVYYISLFFGLLLAMKWSSVFHEVDWLIGPLAVAVIFAIRGTLRNFVEGILITIEGKLKIANFFSISFGSNKVMGTLTDNNLRTSVFKMASGEEVLVRNHDLFNAILTLNSEALVRKVKLPLLIPISISISEVESKVKLILHDSLNVVREYPQELLLKRIQGGYYYFEVHFWILRGQTNPKKMKLEIGKALAKLYADKEFPTPFLREEFSYMPSRAL